MTNYLFEKLLSPRQTSDTIFLSLGNGERISFRDFSDRTGQIANLLTEWGVKPGDRVALQTGKSWQSLALYLATIRAGAVFLPLNTAYTPAEVGYFIENAEPSLLVCDQSAHSGLQPIADSTGARLAVLNNDGSGELSDAADLLPVEHQPEARRADDLAAILYTSGTTGRSKGAMLTHDNLWSNAEVLSSYWCFKESDVLLHALPVFHTHGLFVATNVCLVAGSSMIFLPGFNLDQVIENLPAASVMMGVPTFYTRLLASDRFQRDLVGHMRLFISGSAPLLADTHIEFEERTGHRILERYGMTETNMNSSNPYDGERRAGTVGLALPGVSIRIRSEDSDKPVAAGEIGSIEVKGPNVFQGYWRMPEKTAEEFTEDGYFITGDLGTLGEDGYLSIVGRGKDLIISGGYNIYPKEIELVLDTLEGVEESAVIGVPHPDFGEGVVAVLVGSNQDNLENIQHAIGDRLARFKQPKQVFHLEQLPRNSMGKVQKNLLREQFKDCFDH